MCTLADAVGPLFMLGLLAVSIFAIIIVGLIEGFILYKFGFTETLRQALYHGLTINTLSLVVGLILLPRIKEIDPMWVKAAILVAASIVSEGIWVYFRLVKRSWPLFLGVIVGMNIFTALLIFIASEIFGVR